MRRLWWWDVRMMRWCTSPITATAASTRWRSGTHSFVCFFFQKGSVFSFFMEKRNEEVGADGDGDELVEEVLTVAEA